MSQTQETQGKFDPTALAKASSETHRNIAGNAGAPVADIAAAVAAAAAEAAAKTNADLIATQVVVRQTSNSMLSSLATRIHALRKDQEALEAQVTNIRRIQAYSDAGNSNPELVLTGYGNFIPADVPKSEREVPKDWEPAASSTPAEQ